MAVLASPDRGARVDQTAIRLRFDSEVISVAVWQCLHPQIAEQGFDETSSLQQSTLFGSCLVNATDSKPVGLRLGSGRG